MKTAQIADHLAQAAAQFSFLEITDPRQLLEAVRLELGDEHALDDFVPYGGHLAKAIGPRAILHVLSGNTPHAALQSLLRGLLLGAHNFCKIPAAGLAEVCQFRDALPPELAARIEISSDFHDKWLERAEAVIAFGSDETIAAIAPRISHRQIFIPHAHRVSLGVVFDDPLGLSAEAAARDVSLFDQQGCLSPHVFYVGGAAAGYAAHLATEMEKFNAHTPRSPLEPHEKAQIHAVRSEFAFRAAVDPQFAVWSSPGSTDWTVVLDPEPAFKVSCLNRVVLVKPLPADLTAALHPVRTHLSTIAIWPCNLENANRVSGFGASRICAIGKMQQPPFTWHQDGGQSLAPLVRWIDAEVSSV